MDYHAPHNYLSLPGPTHAIGSRGSSSPYKPDRSRYSDVKGRTWIHDYEGLTLASIDLNTGGRQILLKERSLIYRPPEVYDRSYGFNDEADWRAQKEGGSERRHYSPGEVFTVTRMGLSTLNSPLKNPWIDDGLLYVLPFLPSFLPSFPTDFSL